VATHKVPQDVETDDKLIGFLSLKQFIFVVVGLGFGYLTFFFATKINPFLAIIWVPFTVVPLVLGLYQRRDQPVEVFLASAIRFYFKPRKRKWDQEGYEERVIITAPPKIEHHYTKDFTGAEAMTRLSRLSHMMDSRGWASKLDADWQNPQLAMAAASSNRLVQPSQVSQGSDYLQAYMQPADIMDDQSSVVARDFQNKINQTDNDAHVRAMQTVERAKVAGGIEQQPNTPSPASVKTPEPVPKPQPRQAVNAPKQTITDDGSVEISLH